MDRVKRFLLLLFTCSILNNTFAAPPSSTTVSSTPSLVVSSTEPSTTEDTGKENGPTEATPVVPKIYQMHVTSNVRNRFANTTIVSKVKNSASKSQETTFSVVLPESAFISGFIMEVDGKNYTAYVKEKEEAKKDYDQAVASGIGAAHVAVSARDSNRFTVSVNMEPEKKVAFYLTYEELLKREDGHYEQVINLHPGQPVKDLSVEVIISENRKITDLKAPPLRSGNEIGNENAELDPRADLEIVNDTAAIVRFVPNEERQKQLAHILGTKEEEGLAGQFVIQYDVERDPKGGEVLVQDGYFVHFFAPSELKPLPKHVVFVLDTSGSMYGQKIEQLKEAMHKILEQLHDDDLLTLVEFNSNVKVWDLDNVNSSVWYPRNNKYDYCAWQSPNDNDQETESFAKFVFPKAYAANADNIKKAKNAVSQMESTGGTDIYSGLRVGLHLAALAKVQSPVKRQSMLMFLTDGEPTIRKSLPDEIIKEITSYNSGLRKSPIFALSFGDGADQKFLQKLALRNSGFNKHIYEAADASLQLQDFYNQISSPLLSDVTFKYEPSVTSLTRTEFPIHFGGSELVVAGWCGTRDPESPIVNGRGEHGTVVLKPTVQKAVSNIERLWAYMTVKQLLEKKEASDKEQEELKKKALDLALKYSFVTSVSSLVVVKPNDTRAVDTEKATAAGAEGPVGVNIKLGIGGFGGGGGFPVASFAAAGAPGVPGIQSISAFAQRPGIPLVQAEPALPLPAPALPAPAPLPDAAGAPSILPTTITPQYTTTYSSTIYTTPACPHAASSTSTIENPDLLSVLPWLNDILNEDGIVKLAAGDYKLGLNETISETVACPKTPLGAAGHCKLLDACRQVHSHLNTSDIFVEHFCVLKDEYAGICCPDDS